MTESNGIVDLRSDTVTKPSAAMRRAMADAEVGDDGSGEDPTVNLLEQIFAERVGKEAAVFVPSGTMGNQIALRVLGVPGTAVVAGRSQHVVAFENGAAAMNASVQWHTVDDSCGELGFSDVKLAVELADHHQVPVSAVFVENTHMASSGTPWDVDALDAIAGLGRPVHLDGARLFNLLHTGHCRGMTTDVATGLSRATARLYRVRLPGGLVQRARRIRSPGSAATCRASTGRDIRRRSVVGSQGRGAIQSAVVISVRLASVSLAPACWSGAAGRRSRPPLGFAPMSCALLSLALGSFASAGIARV